MYTSYFQGKRAAKNLSADDFKKLQVMAQILSEGEGEGEVAFFSAKRWDRRNRADLIESATPCHDAQVVGLYRDSNPLRLTILAAMSEDYTTAPQHLLLVSHNRNASVIKETVIKDFGQLHIHVKVSRV